MNQAYAAMNAGVAALQAQPVSGIPLHMVISALRGVEGYNRERMFKAFRSALRWISARILAQAPVQAHMTQALATNVELIKQSRRDCTKACASGSRKRSPLDEPFNQQRLSQLLQREYGSGYNLRRLTGYYAEGQRRPEPVTAAAGRG